MVWALLLQARDSVEITGRSAAANLERPSPETTATLPISNDLGADRCTPTDEDLEFDDRLWASRNPGVAATSRFAASGTVTARSYGGER